MARHARASRVDVSLIRMNGGVQLTVKDDGAGFDPVKKTNQASLGLASMRERIRLVRGRLDLESGSGRGTTVHAWVPWISNAS